MLFHSHSHYVMRDQVRNLVPSIMGEPERKPLRLNQLRERFHHQFRAEHLLLAGISAIYLLGMINHL